ncbi:MAG: hypothetical protein SXV54_22110 [Chloroflexota bacterium]|nr:hypothetical protein [Chloroflexota bacterium]
MRTPRMIVLQGVLILIAASLTGAAYCWQQGLLEAVPILGFVLSLFAFFNIVIWSLLYVGRWGLLEADDYFRNLASAIIQVAQETAEDTVERVPQTVVGGLRRTVEKAGSRFGIRSPLWSRTRSSPEDFDKEQDQDKGIQTSHDSPGQSTYRVLIDKAIEEARRTSTEKS